MRYKYTNFLTSMLSARMPPPSRVITRATNPPQHTAAAPAASRTGLHGVDDVRKQGGYVLANGHSGNDLLDGVLDNIGLRGVEVLLPFCDLTLCCGAEVLG